MEQSSIPESRRLHNAGGSRFTLLGSLVQWETALIFILLLVVVANSLLSPYFLDPVNLLDTTFNFVEKAVIALAMTFVIIAGDIDISVASIVALCSVAMGAAATAGVDTPGLIAIGLLTGLVLGAFNGFLVTRFAIPSIAVTLGTMCLYRGIAYAVLGDQAYTKYPESFGFMGQGYIGDSIVPFELVLFAVLALIAGLVLHKTTFGRKVFATGANIKATRYAGISTNAIRFSLFSITGLMAGLASILLTSRILSTRPNIATGLEFEVITIVILGGIAITGGEGRMIGVILATFILGFLKFGMALVNVPGRVMNIVTGLVLIAAIFLPKAVKGFKDRAELRANSAPAPGPSHTGKQPSSP